MRRRADGEDADEEDAVRILKGRRLLPSSVGVAVPMGPAAARERGGGAHADDGAGPAERARREARAAANGLPPRLRGLPRIV